MGGTEQDSHPASTIKGTLTQTDTQVVQPFSLHVAHTFRSKAGKHTFLYGTIVFVVSNLSLTHSPCTNLTNPHIFTDSVTTY